MDLGDVIAVLAVVGVGSFIALKRGLAAWLGSRAPNMSRAVGTAARRTGLSPEHRSDDPKRLLSGAMNGREVTVSVGAGPVPGQRRPWLHMRVEARLPPGCVMRREGPGGRLRRAVNGPDVLIGVDAFDDAVHLTAPDTPHDLVSRLGDDARRSLRTLLIPGAEVHTRRGHVVAMRRIPRGHPSALSDWIHQVIAFVEAAESGPDSTAERLVRQVLRDPEPGYRLRCFELVTSAPHTDAARAAATSALQHRDLLIRVAAARLLRNEAGVRALSDALARDDLDNQDRVELLDALADLEQPLDSSILLEHLAVDSPGVRAAAARCLGHVGTPGAFDTLTQLLDDPAVAVQIAAAEGLGAAAPIASVAPLLERVDANRRSAAFRRAAREAVSRIQARHGGGAGQLSLPDATSGALALADGSRDAPPPDLGGPPR